MPELKDMIKEMRLKRGLTLLEVAERIGVKEATVQRYESGAIKNIKYETVCKLAKVFGCEPGFLMGWSARPRKAVLKDTRSNISDVMTDGIQMIPVFESVSAGLGAYADSEVMDYVPLFVRNPAEAPSLIGIKVKGDSMYPKIEDGDVIIVRKQTSVDSGSIAVMLLDGEEGLVKKVEYGPDWIDLISINPEYKTRRFEGEEVTRLQVVGLVKQIIKML